MNTVTINDADGMPVNGTYAVAEGGWVKVTCALGVKSAALHNLEPAGLARILLGEIVIKATKVTADAA
jgi:hypothetical protein